MKAKLTLSIAATLALLLFCVVVTVNSPRSLAGRRLAWICPDPSKPSGPMTTGDFWAMA